jgi:hypothetical protein
MKKGTVETADNGAGSAAEKPPLRQGSEGQAVNVWFLVTEQAALIGDAHHAAGKRMVLPKPTAEEAAKQGLGRIDGVA